MLIRKVCIQTDRLRLSRYSKPEPNWPPANHCGKLQQSLASVDQRSIISSKGAAGRGWQILQRRASVQSESQRSPKRRPEQLALFSWDAPTHPSAGDRSCLAPRQDHPLGSSCNRRSRAIQRSGWRLCDWGMARRATGRFGGCRSLSPSRQNSAGKLYQLIFKHRIQWHLWAAAQIMALSSCHWPILSKRQKLVICWH